MRLTLPTTKSGGIWHGQLLVATAPGRGCLRCSLFLPTPRDSHCPKDHNAIESLKIECLCPTGERPMAEATLVSKKGANHRNR